MFSRDSWQEIFQTIKKNKLRTFLSGFTVSLGIFIFVILFGLGNGLKNGFQEFFLNDATNIFWVFSNRTTKPYKGFKSNRTIQFRNDDVAGIKATFPMYLEYVSPAITRSSMVQYKNKSNSYHNQAVGVAYQYAEKIKIVKGRFINELDIRDKTKHAVLGRLVKEDLFGQINPVGRYVNVGGSMFKVIGVFTDSGGDGEERRLYIPYTTRQLLEKNNDKIRKIVVGFKPEIGYVGAMIFDKKLGEYLREKHNIHPDDSRGIFIRNIADNIQENNQFASVLQIIVSFVGFGTLMAGIIGISNIMVFVVKERTKELGIRKALGATPRAVVSMILQESIFITTIAGYVGLVIGVLLLDSIGLKLEDFFIKYPSITISTGLFATIILILFGAVAGYVPAHRAAKIKPIVALRDE